VLPFLTSCAGGPEKPAAPRAAERPDDQRIAARAPTIDRARLAATVRAAMARARVPGIALAVTGSGETWAAGFGVRDLTTGAPVEADTIFEAASMSKPVFAHAVLQLKDEGRIDLDRPLIDQVGPAHTAAVVGAHLSDPRISRITARMVLCHTSGIPHELPEGAVKTLDFDPGTRFRYSDEGYNLLQRAVERLTGQPLEDLMRRRVFEPLDMSSSSFLWKDGFEYRMAVGHHEDGRTEPIWKERHGLAASTLYTTAPDYAKFLQALLERRGLAPSTFREMLAPSSEMGLRRTGGATWGLGVGILSSRRGDVFWQWGDNDFFRGYMAGRVDGTAALVLFTNGQTGLAIADAVMREGLGVGTVLEELGYESPGR